MSEVQETSKRAYFNQMKEYNKKSYNMFIPGAILGWITHVAAKKYFTLEHMSARPWSGIFSAVIVGSIFHYYTWRKRLWIEDMCVREELNERKLLERKALRLKAGSNLENTIIQNYLKNGDKI
jgi:hypothetical protein